MIDALRPPTRWLRVYKSTSIARATLYCIAGAGGSASVFQSWPPLLPASVEIVAVQLPGHEDRRREEPCSDMADLAGHIATEIEDHAHRPFMIFGHSIGAVIAFETARQLEMRRSGSVMGLLVAAYPAPRLSAAHPVLHADMDDESMVERLQHVGVLDEAVASHPQLVQIFLQVLRADLRVAATYPYGSRDRVSCPIWAFVGAADELASVEDMTAWKDHTIGSFRVSTLAGGHSFGTPIKHEWAKELATAVTHLMVNT